MAKPMMRELQVLRSAYVTPHMLRLTLGGEEMDGFPPDQESAYVKLLFPQPGQARPLMRTYTIRQQREGEIDIDFVMHEHTGPASSWARRARPGDRITIGGPGARKLINPEADWFLLAGDMTALPAISVNLESLPASARGYAVISVLDEADIQPLHHPAGVDIQWVIDHQEGENDFTILAQIEKLDWLQGQASVWAACEFSEMHQLRRYFRQRGVPNSHRYISSYWKKGLSEDQHKLVKREDAEGDSGL
ncbi:siderophore-interacting protein [Microbulbifer thermotolerans]|uniref:siderophore-interacting protein n=1 Tax=Microbulbifer thermotolerans TaxID=252514 RepID=UPI00224AA629|nr:siderophore-interacting protein [Microbulbifer thermotolerans]MCX2836302.1 siderophore-interacting protein [Microbulbifer thermotolerans]